MAYQPPSISPFNYNASPPPDSGAQTPQNRITWAGIQTKLTDPLRNWLDAINSEIGRAITETANEGVPVGTIIEYASLYEVWNTSYIGLHTSLSKVTFDRLYGRIGDTWRKDYIGYIPSPDDGTHFLAPPSGRFVRLNDATKNPPGEIRDSQNKLHVHGVNDPGHAHTLGIYPYAQMSEEPSLKADAGTERNGVVQTAAPTHSGSASTLISIQGEGGDEAWPEHIICKGYIKW